MPVSRTLLILACGCLLGWNPVSRALAQTSEQAPPNIIFVLADDLGWGDLGVFYQNQSTHDRKHQTPFLDQMAADGIQLRAHYCPAPVCAPSRASLLLGVHQGHADVRDNQFDKALPDNHTLASVLKAAGYRTAIIGKYGLQGQGDSPATWPAYPTKRGFDEFYGYVAHVDGHQHYPANDYPEGDSETHRSRKPVYWNDREVTSDLKGCYTTDLFTARSKQWIVDHRKQHPDQPFFLYLALDTPHAALQIPAAPYPAGQGIQGGIQWLGKPGQMINTCAETIDQYRHPDYANQPWTDVEQRFATMVRRVDSAVGDLLHTLRDLKIDRNTLVVFTSDNGPHHESYLAGRQYDPTSFRSYGPFDGTKRDTWEGGIRMPALVWAPGLIAAGQIDETPSQFQDWMPTFAELAGTPAPACTDGVSLVPTLTGVGQQQPSTVYIEYAVRGRTQKYDDFAEERRGKKRFQMQVLFKNGLKGVRTDIQSSDDPFAIYDVRNDPGERNNLATSSSAMRSLEQAMRRSVLQMRVPNASAKRPYDDALIPPDEGNANLVQSAAWRGFQGLFPYTPQLPRRQPDQSGVSDTMSAKLDRPGVIEFETYVKVETAGRHRLEFSCPTRAVVRLHEATVIDADQGYQSGNTLKQEMLLQPGLHRVRVTVLTDDQGQASFELECIDRS